MQCPAFSQVFERRIFGVRVRDYPSVPLFALVARLLVADGYHFKISGVNAGQSHSDGKYLVFLQFSQLRLLFCSVFNAFV